ncbi:hypothetical protein [Brevundimonas subvibrioides]|uniref:Uncharacterized protein n=1 Tax=Brevundimonas subvibrioides (strain ATCC 15264 / DSM 4735 / LMG 14903 / NBRC 16000 / CB 81) TaxID=633149 RepID=D9QIL7_BRESC|nr:hypothetical protein [Brevundimonas subvibrioides]ADL01350.1 conserved hypothetical protein [Brevundimonas subvibrioides ATCC 15264]
MIARDELYRLVWTKPMTQIAEQFDVSGSYLARICTLLNVPRPARGYWAKLAVGKAPAQTPLPVAQPGDPLHWSKDREHVAPQKLKAPPRRRRVAVRIDRSRIHGLIRGARTHFENGRPVDDGDYLKPYKKLLVDVTASKACLDKALNLANDLFGGLESVGHRVVLAPSDAKLRRSQFDEREVVSQPRDYWQHNGPWSPYRPTVVYVGTVAIGLAIVETSETVTLRYLAGKYVRETDYVPPRGRHAVDHSWTTTRDLPSGRMRIIAYSPYGRVNWSMQWQESKSAALSSQIRTIVQAIESAAPDLVAKLEEADRQAELRHQQWLAEEERRRQEDDRRRVKQSVADSRSELGQVIKQWSDVMSVERFLAGVEHRARDLPETDRRELLERLALARSFLGDQDPLAFFREWKTPEERYAPQYPIASGTGGAGSPGSE